MKKPPKEHPENSLPESFWLKRELGTESDIHILAEGDEEKFYKEVITEELGILPLRNTVLYPGATIPITVARDKSIQLVKDAYQQKLKLIGVVAQRTPEIEDPNSTDLYEIGTVAAIQRLIQMPDGSVTIIIQGRCRIQVQSFTQREPYLKAKIQKILELYPPAEDGRALIIALKSEASKFIALAPHIPSDAGNVLSYINSLSFLIHFVASLLNLPLETKQKLLEVSLLLEKARMVLENIQRELTLLELSEEIQSKVKNDLDKQQRDYILRQQIKAIQDELGEFTADNDIEELRARADRKLWTLEAFQAFNKEISKLQRINPGSPEYGVAMNYLDWMLDLPWSEYTRDRFNLKIARKILDRDHFGMEKVKERILEYLAVLKLKGDMKAPILCFYGPPGVGKTSLGRSISEALNRKFVRISLGGVRDEAEIRGHRRTYIGAMPGRILQGLKKAKSGNPVFILDEIDKVGNDFRGDPSAALLEVLDPEQNNAFNDHYLELDYDLSPIMFIATANNLDSIHPALRDRMEIIEINGYTLEEKLEIAKRHLIPRQKDEHGLRNKEVNLSDSAIQYIIESYTRESGVRNLTQRIAGICRGVAKEIVENGVKTAFEITQPDQIRKYLGPIRFENEAYQQVTIPGVSIGMAWTAVGGEILFVETALMRGTGRLNLTGQLGEVMKESATLAYTYLKANADLYRIPQDVFKHWDVHIHLPAGAIPKDGPSAGITMLTAMASVMTQRLVRPNLAMSGEITLRGKVLPVGGIKEKVLAAVRSGMTEIILCKDNIKDVEDINPEHIKNCTIHYVTQMSEVLALALEQNPIPNPLKLIIEPAETKPQPAIA